MTDREALAARIEAATGPDLTEQIARALYEADDPWHEAFPWPNPDGLGVAANYRRIAQDILPLIEAAVLAERERCAEIADTLGGDRVERDQDGQPRAYDMHSNHGRGDAILNAQRVRAQSIAAAIRSQPWR